MRILFISLEFLGPVFSGNGIYSRSLVRSLLAKRGVDILVLSGRSAALPMDAQDPEWVSRLRTPHGLVDIPLETWGRLDRGSGWEALALGATAPRVIDAVCAFRPDIVLAVDWHAAHAWGSGLRPRLLEETVTPEAHRAASAPCVYLNFRVYSTSIGLVRGDGDSGCSDAAFYRQQELAAVRGSACTVALCRADAVSLAALAAGFDPLTKAPLPRSEVLASAEAGGVGSAPPDIRVLLPPLRQDVLDLQQQKEEASGGGPEPPRRDLIVCAVRLSPEKGAHRLGGWLRHLAPTLEALGLTPFVCGGRSADGAYSDAVIAGVRDACPGAIISEAFMGPAELCRVFARAALNIHPCLADAYGMTVVEAAACGAPSLVHVPSLARAGGGGGGGGGGGLLLRPSDCFTAGRDSGGSGTSGGDDTDAGAAGYLRMRLERCVAPRGPCETWQEAARALLDAPLTTVGACDLLAPTVLEGGGSCTDSSGVVACDLEQPDAAVAAAVAMALESSAGLRAKASAARGVALGWTETLSRTALLHVVSELCLRE